MNILAVSIKTIPDIDTCRHLYDLHGLSDDDVAKAVLHKRRQQMLDQALPVHLQRIVSISVILSRSGQFKVWSLGDDNAGEEDLLQRFYDGLERYHPCLVTWNGRRVDLSVIQCRSLRYPLNAGSYWGSDDTREHPEPMATESYYLHNRHIDLKHVLVPFISDSGSSQDELAQLCGFPGAGSSPDDTIWGLWLKGDIDRIRQMGEEHVLNTYLLYLNWERNRGNLSVPQHESQCNLVRDSLKTSDAAHLLEFEKNWV
jgi:hypothetical protein